VAIFDDTKERDVAIDIEGLKGQVQYNCDVSDAGYGGVFSLCGFLLRLRDLYKWQHGFLPWEEPEPSDLMEWVSHREEHWEEIAENDLQDITINGKTFHPFDVKAINKRLRPLGLIYGGGYVAGMKPSFFLAELLESRKLGELQVDLVERELVRDLYTTPAMRQGKQIFARRSAMLFFLWDQILEMRPSAKEALVFALAQYGLDAEAIRRSPKELGWELKKVAASELETWIYHEIGEVREDIFPGKLWHEIVSTYSNSPIEMFARVIKDLIADTHPEGLLGYIIQHDCKSSLAFYVSFLRPFTREFFPEMRQAFNEFRPRGDWSLIENARRKGYERGHRNALALIELHEAGRTRGTDWAKDQILSQLIEPLGILRRSHNKT
jgi:hypothetical protein